MHRRHLKHLVSLAAVAFAAMPIAAHAQAPIAPSVYTAMKGAAGGLVTPPDANGDSFGQLFDFGPVTGGFSGSMGWQLNYVVHTRTGLVGGTGTVVCDPCTVNGLIGTVNFNLTIIGQATLFSCGPPNLCADFTSLGGTWTISSATGALVGLTGSGTWTHQLPATGNRLLSGSAPSGCDATGNWSGNHQCNN
jgi:hypothetical protein